MLLIILKSDFRKFDANTNVQDEATPDSDSDSRLDVSVS